VEAVSDEEPIRQLTDEEYTKLLASIRKSREVLAKNGQSRLEENVREITNAELAIGEEAAEIGLAIWKLRKEGNNLFEIHEQLELPLDVIRTCLEDFERRVSVDASRALEHYRILDDERIEGLLKVWLPIATGGPIKIEKVRAGEVFVESDYDRPLRASYFCLQAIERRVKILQASQPEATRNGQGSTQILVWLQSVLPNVQKLVGQIESNGRASAKETLILESDAESSSSGLSP
jgi:hypothetical protein